MSGRLGAALARHIHELPGKVKFVLVEGVNEELAEAMAAAWGDASTPLAIASQNPVRFGSRALVGVSGTALRNKTDDVGAGGGAGVCVVICEGAQLADRQSLRSFASVAPGDLLKTAIGLTYLAQVEPAAPLDGPARDVRHAIVQAGDAARPSAALVADYLDRCATGEAPMRALPALGAFADYAVDRPDVRRILANFALAARRRGEQATRPADVRRRAERVLARRPALDISSARREADRVVALLQSGSDELLSLLTYDEAVEILDQRSSDLPTAVRYELRHYRQTRVGEDDVAWERYEDAARDLSDPDRQKQAARDLLGFGQIEGGAVFEAATRRRLEQLLKDRVVTASRPSCPELALLRCAIALGGIGAVELTAPIRNPGGAENRSGAVQELALACCRLRLGRLLRDLEDDGATVDGALLLPAGAAWPAIFEDAQLESGPGLPTVQIRIRSQDANDSRMISWRPDFDDLAALRAALAFSEQPALTLRAALAPTLQSFCSGPAPVPEPVPSALSAVAQALQQTAADALENGFSPDPLDAWAQRWQQAVEEEERAGRAQDAETLALAGAIVTDGPIALTAFAPLKSEWLSQYLDGGCPESRRNLRWRSARPVRSRWERSGR